MKHIINPLEVLDEMLVECEHLPDIAAQVMALRIWHLNDVQVKPPTMAEKAIKDTPLWVIELHDAEIKYAQSFQGENETNTDWRRRRDRLRHKVKRIKEKHERDELPPLVKVKPRDKWLFAGLGSSVDCPHCKAKAGNKCRNMTGGGIHSKVAKPHVPANSSHKRRKEAEQARREQQKIAGIEAARELINERPRLNEEPSTFGIPYPEVEPPYSVLNT